MRRRWMAAASLVVLLGPSVAWADASIAGQWEAKPGKNVIIAMDVLADGYWFSQTVQNNKVIAEMAGSYEQKKESDTTGTLVFTPDKAKTKTTAEHGAAQVETDRYTLKDNGTVLTLVSSADNNPMDFHKQKAKR
jgi:hypothetical protein